MPSPTASEVRSHLLAALAATADEPMARHGFRRRARSLSYVRSLGGTRQILEFHSRLRPGAPPGTLLHLYPRVTLENRALSDLAVSLVRGANVLLPDAGICFSRPFDHLVPSGSARQWYVGSVEELASSIRSVLEQFGQWGLPFFEAYRAPADIIQGYAQHDPRLRIHWLFALFVVAACVHEGRLPEGLRLLRQELGDPSQRAEYEAALGSLRRLARRGGSGRRRVSSPKR